MKLKEKAIMETYTKQSLDEGDRWGINQITKSAKSL